MKYKILCNLDLKGCERQVKVIKKFSNFYNIFSKSDIDKILAQISIFVCSASIKIDKKFLDKANNLKFIFSPSTGTDHIDLLAAKKKKN